MSLGAKKANHMNRGSGPWNGIPEILYSWCGNGRAGLEQVKGWRGAEQPKYERACEVPTTVQLLRAYIAGHCAHLQCVPCGACVLSACSCRASAASHIIELALSSYCVELEGMGGSENTAQD